MNFTLSDLAGALCALVLFVPFVVSPGYVAGWILDPLEFRSRPFGEKLPMALPMSTTVVPIFLYLIGRFFSIAVCWSCIALTFVAFVFLGVRDFRRRAHPLAGAGWAVAMGLVWVVIGLTAMVDFEWKGHLYIAASSFDFRSSNRGFAGEQRQN